MSYVDKIREKVEHPNDKYGFDAFYQAVVGLGVDNLRQNMLMYQKHLQETNHALKNNQEILKAAEQVRNLEKPYKDAIKENLDKIKQLKRFVDDSICVEDLEKQIVIHTMRAERQKIKMSMDHEVNDAKNELKELKGPFNDAKKNLDIKIAYLNILIEEKSGMDED